MKYKKLLLSLTLLNCAGLVIALLFSNTKLNSFTGADANSDSYRIEFDKDKIDLPLIVIYCLMVTAILKLIYLIKLGLLILK